MELFDSRIFYYLMDVFRRDMAICEELKKRGDSKPTDGLLTSIKTALRTAQKFCEKAEFTGAREKIALTNVHLDSYSDEMDFSALYTEIRNAEEMLMVDFWERKFIAIPLGYKDYVNNDSLFGPEVTAAFPNAVEDIREAG